VPASLLSEHRTKPGVWGLIHVTQGTVIYQITGATEPIELTGHTPGVIEPETLHSVRPSDNAVFYVEFWR
tara:strand:- start:312 stop:521 length:210 start_codon:yes stop_codon:yes gene_type:complete